MQLYDNDIIKIKNQISGYPFVKLERKVGWSMEDKESLILRRDMAYELGGGEFAAVSGLAFTFSEDLVGEDGVFLCGEDLSEISSDRAYGRITLLRLSKALLSEEEQALYELLRKIEFVRYHFFPYGYMMRISPAREREPVRISKSALEQGISFGKIGDCFEKAYKKLSEVEAVQTYFVTLPDFPYHQLEGEAHHLEQITRSMNHIFEDISMDCSSCGLKEICDEVEGLRELHFGHKNHANPI
jgi:CO dehydrogenase/acetyl-CoA synthase beta subunit